MSVCEWWRGNWNYVTITSYPPSLGDKNDFMDPVMLLLNEQ